MIKKSPFIKGLLAILLIFLGSFIWNESLLYSQNNLLFNSHWESYKKNFYTTSASDIYSFLSRTLLANNRLVTNKNLGNQMIFSKFPVLLKELEFDLELQNTGYVDLIFNSRNDQFEAIRLNLNGPGQTFYYKAQLGGKFLEKDNFNLKFNSNGKLHIFIRQLGDSLQFFINNETVYKRKEVFLNGHFGFYTSLQGLEINKVVATDENGKKIEMPFTRDYDRTGFLKKNTIFYFLFLLIFSVGLFLFLKEDFLFLVFKNALFFFLLGVLWFSYDYFYYSKIPKTWNYNQFTFVSDIDSPYDFERFRYNLFSHWFRWMGGEIPTTKKLNSTGVSYSDISIFRRCFENKCVFEKLENILTPKKADVNRIACFGGSYANFAGISNLDDSYFDKFAHGMNQKLKKTEIVNFAFSGVVFNKKVDEIKSLIERFSPDTVIISIFLTNPDFKAFNKFAEDLKLKNILLVYQRPLNQKDFFTGEVIQSLGLTKEFRQRKFREKFWKRMKVRDDIFYIDSEANAVGTELEKNGLLWWDTNHMTAYGQAFMANDLLSNVLEKLK